MDKLAARRLKKSLAWGFWGLNLAVILGFWWFGTAGQEILNDGPLGLLHAVARLFGLLAMFCALTQFILMGRVGWLEPIFGLDHLAIFHRRNGIATISLLLSHSFLTTLYYYTISKGVVVAATLPYVWLAVVAEVILVGTVIASIIVVRKHLKFETWYGIHMLNYLAIIIVPFHQLVNGTDFAGNPAFVWYWLGLYAFVALNIMWWRFGMTLYKSWRYDFRVDKVVRETPTAVSVYIKGRGLKRLKAKGGQFVLVRFFDGLRVLQEHPFSLSMLPTDDHIRITARELGDFTDTLAQLQPGIPVWVSGPFGVYTNELQTKPKVAYIAGGIGITPIRSMLEERANTGEKDDAVLLYGNRTLADTALLDELNDLATQLAMPLHNVLSEDKAYKGEQGYIDKPRIAKLVPDIAERDVFLCGPPPMMKAVKAALMELGVPTERIYYERFSLHKD